MGPGPLLDESRRFVAENPNAVVTFPFPDIKIHDIFTMRQDDPEEFACAITDAIRDI